MTASSETDKIFFIVDQLNQGSILLIDPEERLTLSRFGLKAGMKAKEMAAFQIALQYIEGSIQLLPANSWETAEELTRSLNQEAARLAYLCGLFEKAVLLSHNAIQHGKTVLENVAMYELNMDIEAALLHTGAAIKIGTQILEMLGIPLESEPPGELNLDELFHLPAMTDPAALAALPILSKCVPAAYQLSAELLNSVVYTMVKTSITYGNDPHSAFAYAMYGLLLSSSPDTMELGYRFGELGVNLLQQFNSKALECRVKHIFYSHICFTQLPLSRIFDPMHEAIQVGLAHGDFEFVSYIGNVRCHCFLFSSPKLEDAILEYEEEFVLMKKLKIEHGIISCAILRQMALNLARNPTDPTLLTGPDFDEKSVLAKIYESNQRNLLAFFYMSKLIICYLIGDMTTAFKYADTMLDGQYEQQLRSLYVEIIYKFYFSLLFFSQYENLTSSEIQKYVVTANAYHDHIKILSEHCPENYLCLYCIIGAVKAKSEGHFKHAIKLFNQACCAAKKYRQIQFEALA